MEFIKKKTALSSLLALALSVGVTGCSDRFDLDDDGNSPSWLGNSIYEELKNPNPENLTGTFNNFIRLVDDLNYAETLGKTGSKTVFVANDEAFERFFANNSWGVRSYEQLTLAQKKQLFFGSMLDNALLVEMLSNVPYDGTSVTKGVALKHGTGLSTIDSITYVAPNGSLPVNNSYWDWHRNHGINMVMDATQPMLVHFTADQMRSNDITLTGGESDFQVVTGLPYETDENGQDPAFVFRNRIINSDVVCKNGYIHQLQDVLVQPGNLAEVIRTNGSSNLFSRMMDRFSAPFYDANTTNSYRAYAQENGLPPIDSIFQKRYFSERSQRNLPLRYDRFDNIFPELLLFDPGWNEYTVNVAGANALSDLCTIFVPNDEAMSKYFLPGGSGAFIMEQYGKKENTPENLEENIDSIPLNIVSAFINNLMNNSFNGSVPSKFGDVMDDASDPMGLSTDVIQRNADGVYDVKIANNGVAYMLNTVFAPNKYVAVSAPALLNSDMRVMNEAINDGDAGKTYLNLGQNFYAYLLAMKANYALFIPDDNAFKNYYVDPASLAHTSTTNPPRVLRFYYDGKQKTVACSQWRYDPQSGAVGDSIGLVTPLAFRSQLIDILNYHTIVLNDGETFGTKRFYKTKHGAAVEYNTRQQSISTGGSAAYGVNRSNIKKVYNQKNGVTYAIDHVIQAPTSSVYSVLNENEQFSEFMALCSYLEMDDMMAFASDRLSEMNPVTKKKRMAAYHTFVNKFGLTDNVNYFNSFNYTVYAPDNEAMKKAYDLGLPKWTDIKVIYDEWIDKPDSRERQEARDKALAMVEAINAFIRYHFQDNSVFVDSQVEGGEYATANADSLGIRDKLIVSGGNFQLTLKDNSGQQITVKEDGGGIVNKLTRDYVFNTLATLASSITTSSFAVIHQISTPLNSNRGTNRYDSLWKGANAKKKLAAFRQQYDTKLYKRY